MDQLHTGDGTVETPSWEQIEAAILAMDGSEATEVFLHPDREEPETYLSIFGGTHGRYGVCYSHRNEWFEQVVTPDAPAAAVELTAGGQPAEYRRTELVTLDEALTAARHFYRTGERGGALHWQRS